MESDEARISKHFQKGPTSTPPRSGSGLGAGNPKCPRCQKSVYANEKVVAIGQDWHIACLKCTSCSKRLDATILTEHESQPYCKGCYGAKFGPKGFGYVTTQHTEGGTGEKAINAAGPESTSTSYQGVTGSAPVAGHASAASPRAKFCPSCGTPANGANFCPGCGHKL